ncbi:hypothetical protein DPEC_G00135010 [Dallia pectoralis]|uniref:Uncharacterized protein n=1 Tax=Dallia pectoralis TaxID=75939 RepID=A0ACC2GRM7_DALPE|nr:hypothetical protein DPEC_G00135010 [Dallia pectoralis]
MPTPSGAACSATKSSWRYSQRPKARTAYSINNKVTTAPRGGAASSREVDSSFYSETIRTQTDTPGAQTPSERSPLDDAPSPEPGRLRQVPGGHPVCKPSALASYLLKHCESLSATSRRAPVGVADQYCLRAATQQRARQGPPAAERRRLVAQTGILSGPVVPMRGENLRCSAAILLIIPFIQEENH